MFVAFELLCRMLGWGEDSVSGGHVAELTSIRPLFVLPDGNDEYRIAENRRLYFAEERFPATKAADEFRVFVVGGSTVQGRPFSIETSFARYLEMSLNRAAPDVRWRVVNCGGISYASYRLVPIVEECVRYEPDLIIVCTGHNEYLEFATYAAARQSTAVTTAYRFFDRLQSFRLLERGVSFVLQKGQRASSIATLPTEVDALLDHQGGLEEYTRSKIDRDQVVAGFRDNLNRMAETAAEAAVPMLVVRPPSNLADCPPFKSEFTSSTSAQSRAEIQHLLTDAADLLSSGDTIQAQAAVRQLQTVTQRDSGFALGWYQLGRALLNQRRYQEAAEAFQRACDEDICPLRMTTALSGVMWEVIESRGLSSLDADGLLAESARYGIVGDSVLVDHVHPSFQGHLAIAFALVAEMTDEGWVTPTEWTWRRDAKADFETHLQSLDDLYFLRGRQMLSVLKVWAAGRADGTPLHSGGPEDSLEATR